MLSGPNSDQLSTMLSVHLMQTSTVPSLSVHLIQTSTVLSYSYTKAAVSLAIYMITLGPYCADSPCFFHAALTVSVSLSKLINWKVSYFSTSYFVVEFGSYVRVFCVLFWSYNSNFLLSHVHANSYFHSSLLQSKMYCILHSGSTLTLHSRFTLRSRFRFQETRPS